MCSLQSLFVIRTVTCYTYWTKQFEPKICYIPWHMCKRLHYMWCWMLMHFLPDTFRCSVSCSWTYQQAYRGNSNNFYLYNNNNLSHCEACPDRFFLWAFPKGRSQVGSNPAIRGRQIPFKMTLLLTCSLPMCGTLLYLAGSNLLWTQDHSAAIIYTYVKVCSLFFFCLDCFVLSIVIGYLPSSA